MKTIIITIDDDDENLIGMTVAVPDGISTCEAIGYMEMAKLQHLEAKRAGDCVVHVEQTPDARLN